MGDPCLTLTLLLYKCLLVFRGIRDEALEFGVVKEMLTQFGLMLKKLADENEGCDIYASTQETLQPTSK